MYVNNSLWLGFAAFPLWVDLCVVLTLALPGQTALDNS